MRCFALPLLIGIMLWSFASQTQAGWREFWRRTTVDWHRVNCWPEPFIYPDRDAARAPFQQMVDRGWQRETTLGDYHFDSDTQLLNEAGELQLRWVMTQAPQHRRSVLVLRGSNTDATSIRIDSVQQAATKIQPAGPLPPVVQTDVPPAGSPADAVDAYNRKYFSTIPDPRLPKPASGDGS